MQSLADAGGYSLPPNTTFNKGSGCHRCRQAGYKGRIQIYEFMPMNPAIADAIPRRASTEELSNLAVEQDMRTLVAESVKKAVEGVTTIDEVMRVIFLN